MAGTCCNAHGCWRQVETEVGRPRVNYLEAITRRAEFDYLHKKQSGMAALSVAAFAHHVVKPYFLLES